MSSIASISASALVSSVGRFNAAAGQAVQAADGGGDGLAEASVALSQAKVQVSLAATVARTADQMSGTLLDILA